MSNVGLKNRRQNARIDGGSLVAEKRDYYEVLEVPKDADQDALKKSFRSLARKYHPDKNPDDSEAEQLFKEVQEAYAVLSNPEQRRQYDMFGHDSPSRSPFGPGGFRQWAAENGLLT